MNGAQHAVAGLGRLDGNRRRFRIADFPDENHIRVLTENGAQSAREGHPGLPVQLDLANVVDAVFDGVFQCDNVDVRLVDGAEDRVKAGAFAAAGRSGAQDQTVRLHAHGLYFVPVRGYHAQSVQRIDAAAHVEHSQNEVFTVDGRDGGDSDIDFLAAHFQCEAAVLGNAGHGNVHIGQYFDAGDNRQEERLGRRRNLDQFAVHAKAHLDVVLLRADVDVAGAVADRLRENRVSQTDNRRFARHVLKGGHGNLCFPFGRRLFLAFFGRAHLHAFHNAAQTGLRPVEGTDQLIKLPFRTDHGLHFGVGQHFNIIQRVDVQGIDNRDGEQPAFFSQRRHLVFLRGFNGNKMGQRKIQRILIGVIFGYVELPAQHIDDLLFVHHSLAREILAQFQAGFLLVNQGLLKPFLREQTAVNQHLTQAFFDFHGFSIRK
ncbi:MAG: hypothetical protein BWX83_01127 [Candidatus Cloacimonetes bacterium ADurb.Bin117]|nr:MAG: hypothetical protein BWX83_01127 [Candidatus Cloacimonetes bacterium ADurb.Bin117]